MKFPDGKGSSHLACLFREATALKSSREGGTGVGCHLSLSLLCGCEFHTIFHCLLTIYLDTFTKL